MSRLLWHRVSGAGDAATEGASHHSITKQAWKEQFCWLWKGVVPSSSIYLPVQLWFWASISGGILISGHWVLLIYKSSKRVYLKTTLTHAILKDGIMFVTKMKTKTGKGGPHLSFPVSSEEASSEAVDKRAHRFWSGSREKSL